MLAPATIRDVTSSCVFLDLFLCWLERVCFHVYWCIFYRFYYVTPCGRRRFLNQACGHWGFGGRGVRNLRGLRNWLIVSAAKVGGIGFRIYQNMLSVNSSIWVIIRRWFFASNPWGQRRAVG